jgi:hypothetical protein
MTKNMNNDELLEKKEIANFKSEIAKTTSTRWKKALDKFILAALGSIPWVGGFIAATASLKTESGDDKREDLQNQWLEEHEKKMKKLGISIMSITQRFDNIGEQINDRLESEEYLDIVRKAFRAWDDADTDEKRNYVANLIANSAGTRICSDDVIRLFIDWLNLYHESHFAVIKEIYNNPGVNRYDVWMAIYKMSVREDSAEADLYKMLIRDLSIGGVIRQVRDTTEDGRFLKRKTIKTGIKSTTMESAFENTKQYILTELGKQFVHYTMTELVQRIKNN